MFKKSISTFTEPLSIKLTKLSLQKVYFYNLHIFVYVLC